jgi:hypothetical protein
MEPGLVVCACNTRVLETEAEGSWIWGQSGLQSKTLLKNIQNDSHEDGFFCSLIT